MKIALYSRVFYTLCAIALVICTGTAGLQALVGCRAKHIHRSRHTSERDYKTLHFVKCSCPCNRYAHLSRRGECARCGHYHTSDEITPRNVAGLDEKTVLYF